MHLLNRIVIEPMNENFTDPLPLPVIVLWPITCPSPQIRAWLWKGAQKGFRVQSSGEFSALSHFLNFQRAVFYKHFPHSVFFRNLHVQSFYKFSPCPVLTGIFAQYFSNSYAQYFSEFSRLRENDGAQPLQFFSTKFTRNSLQRWDVYRGPVLTRDSFPFEYYRIHDFYRYIWIRQFCFNTNIPRHCER